MASHELIPSRNCRHVDWRAMRDAGLDSCWSCGMTFRTTASSAANAYAAYKATIPSWKTSFDGADTLTGFTRFSYLPLNPDQGREIRVLTLHAGVFDEPLSCNLETVNLQLGPVYEAVSYTWADSTGDDELAARISATMSTTTASEEGDITITRNCEAMLRRLRRANVTRRLWVDAICIDQANLDERSAQVRNMTAVFRNAQRVVVYLGEGDSVTNRLLDYASEDHGEHVLPSPLDFLPLYQCRWFHRVWVLQEIAVAKTAIVISGTRTLEWTDLVNQARVFLRLVNKWQNQRIPLPPVLAYGFRSGEMGNKIADKSLDLLSIMQISRGCSCKDARDKVYAVAGLVSEDARVPLPADYSPDVTPERVYTQLAAWHVLKTSSPRILRFVEGPSSVPVMPVMSSWVPDWTTPSPGSSLPPQLPVNGVFIPPQIVVP
ncbi:heterokaryon incompatibility protein-domain-containing protein, partial [Podospora didyma]